MSHHGCIKEFQCPYCCYFLATLSLRVFCLIVFRYFLIFHRWGVVFLWSANENVGALHCKYYIVSLFWLQAILGYRETERKNWTQKNKGILERVKQLAFSPDASLLPYVHVLDLKASGVIKPHVDSVKVEQVIYTLGFKKNSIRFLHLFCNNGLSYNIYLVIKHYNVWCATILGCIG